MTECSTDGCREGQVISWPMLGSTGLCGKHHDHPTPQFAGLVAESNAPPDDFDIPEWDEPFVFNLPRYLTAAKDTWVTKEGRAIPIQQLEDDHLCNIDRMLRRLEVDMDRVDDETQDPIGSGMSGGTREMFDRKQSAIKSEMGRRELHDKV